MLRSSFSQHNLFSKCRRWWFLQYVKKLPAIQDLTYAHAGKVLHDCLEKWYNRDITSLEKLKVVFSNIWESKDLHNSKIALRKDSYWLMVLNGTQVNRVITSTELKIFYPEVVAYLDAVNTTEDEISDWKSSTRSLENEIEYKKQLQMYAWLYYRKFNRIPKKCTVYYLKYNGSKCELSFEFNIDDIKEIEEWYNTTLKEMENVIEKNQVPECCTVCSPWCSYENYCKSNEKHFQYTLDIIGNYIIVNGPLSSLLHKGLSKKFSYELKNAYFIKKANPYARTNVMFWNLQKQSLPIGFLEGLKKTLTDYASYNEASINIDVVNKRVFDNTKINMPDKFLNDIELRDYQIEAVEKFLQQKIGMLEAATGSGKTEIAIEVIRRLGVKTLFVTDKIELCNQTKERIEKALGVEVGIIGQGVMDIKPITIGMIQTLVKNLHILSKYLKEIRLCVMDECHHIAAQSYWQLSNYLVNTEYRLGLSATPFREDGNEMYLEAIGGKIFYNLNAKKLIDEGWLTKPTITFIKNFMTKEEVEQMENRCLTGLINEKHNYNTFYKSFIMDNEIRNNKIIEIVNNNNNKKILILTKLVDHGAKLAEMLNTKHLFGGTNKEERKQIMNDFRDGSLNVLVGTMSIFAEGIDCPALDMVINASANKGDAKSIQVLGRVMRLFEGKEKAIYFDFMDEHRFFKRASNARKIIFKKEGHEVNVCEDINEKTC